jgi:hypothetical protein
MGVTMNIDLMSGEGQIEISYCSDAFQYRGQIMAFIGRLLESDSRMMLDRCRMNRELRVILVGYFSLKNQNKIRRMVEKLFTKKNE